MYTKSISFLSISDPSRKNVLFSGKEIANVSLIWICDSSASIWEKSGLIAYSIEELWFKSISPLIPISLSGLSELNSSSCLDAFCLRVKYGYRFLRFILLILPRLNSLSDAQKKHWSEGSFLKSAKMVSRPGSNDFLVNPMTQFWKSLFGYCNSEKGIFNSTTYPFRLILAAE